MFKFITIYHLSSNVYYVYANLTLISKKIKSLTSINAIILIFITTLYILFLNLYIYIYIIIYYILKNVTFSENY